jgi:hypothetical protein
MSMWMLT